MEWLEYCTTEFRKMKGLADRAVAVLSDEQLRLALDPESNSVAVIMQHLAGNLRSRWSDFLTTDGEKPDRHRDQEFMEAQSGRKELLARWEEGWQILFSTLASLKPEDLGRTVLIRSEPHTVPQAILRQVAHYGYHVGQIVLLAKHHAGDRWQPLSIPRGQSDRFNAEMQRPHG